MNSSELLSLFRQEMNDNVAPYLWSDEEVFSFEDDAQKMFCRKTDGISDATTPAVVSLAVTPGTTWVNLHPAVLKIRGCVRIDTGRPVEVINREDMAPRGWYFDGTTTGPVKALVVGEEAHKARVYPKSNETVGIELLTFRLPLTEITTEGDEAFEVDAEHHRHLLLWMKHLAYSKQDAEAYDKTKAAEFEAKFIGYCEQVKEEERRKRHKVRVVMYGGI